MGICDCIANIDEALKQFAKLKSAKSRLIRPGSSVKSLDCILEVVALDKAHRIIWASVGVGSKSVYRYDSWVFQSTGDFGLEDESATKEALIGAMNSLASNSGDRWGG
jgi:hypothetical protein